MRCGVHIYVAFHEEFHQPRVELYFNRAADMEKIRTGDGQRPKWEVKPTRPLSRPVVLLLDATARGGRTNSSPPRDRLEPCRVGKFHIDVGFDGDRPLTPRGVPPTSRHAMIHISPGQHTADGSQPGTEPTGRRNSRPRLCPCIGVGPSRIRIFVDRMSLSFDPVMQPRCRGRHADLGSRGES